MKRSTTVIVGILSVAAIVLPVTVFEPPADAPPVHVAGAVPTTLATPVSGWRADIGTIPVPDYYATAIACRDNNACAREANAETHDCQRCRARAHFVGKYHVADCFARLMGATWLHYGCTANAMVVAKTL